jgi:hypothetical protein
LASYHYSHKPVSRAKGQSAVAGAAYRAADKLYDRTLDQTFDYTRRTGVLHAEMVLPTQLARGDLQWNFNRQELWNRAEEAERRRDSRIAREHEIALPHELNRAQQLKLLRAFSQEIADRYRVAVDFALHRPHRKGDARNFHAHVYATTREVTATGLGPKATIELSDTDRYKRGLPSGRVELKAVRARFEQIQNEHLAAHGIKARVDCRTLEEQGIDRIPTTHLGPAVSGMQRRGMDTQVGDRIREQTQQEAQRRLERASELGWLEREGLELKRSILELSTDLREARAFRRQEQRHTQSERGMSMDELAREAAEKWAREYGNKPRPSMEELQRQSREAWLKQRQQSETTVKKSRARKPVIERDAGDDKEKPSQREQERDLGDDFEL